MNRSALPPTTQQFSPGMRVSLKSRPDYGIGRVQSAIGNKVTVDFDDMGKVIVDLDHAELVIVSEPRTDR